MRPDATAEVYGGVPVAGWEKWKGNIWRAKVPAKIRFFDLVVDGPDCDDGEMAESRQRLRPTTDRQVGL